MYMIMRVKMTYLHTHRPNLIYLQTEFFKESFSQ